VPDGTSEPKFNAMVYTETARPGHRAPHVWIGDTKETSTLDLFGKGFVLMRFDPLVSVDTLVEAFGLRRVPLSIKDLDQMNIFKIYEFKLVLVRPDGHVAWRGNSCPHDALVVADTVRGA
jgi:hypothetical protein